MTYADKTKSCGDSINVFEMRSAIDTETGEIITAKKWQAIINHQSNRMKSI